ncbi:MAG: polymerase sigma-70 factor, subfamily [Streptosporangiaceae bacterium]|nr:polymerase sigma-70 factor, subfamily [Streptosporangiaceae bacterium]
MCATADGGSNRPVNVNAVLRRMAMVTVTDDFAGLTDPLRGELLAHCYRMLGSVHDAEDLVQETYLRAWRSYGAFEGRSSLRTWLYRIATNACLNALEHSSRRVLPSGLARPADDPEQPTSPAHEVAWLEPIPDRLIGPAPEDPAAIIVSRQSTRLALIAALQYLPARQRTVLILLDILRWRASEAADLLGTTTTAINSALQRARAQLERLAPVADDINEPTDPAQRELLDRYAAAFENADIAGLTQLLTQDAAWEMPPIPAWFAGREAIGRLVESRWSPDPGGSLLVPTRANGQPAFALFTRRDDGIHHAHSIQVLTITKLGVARVVAFHHLGLFTTFGLPATLPATTPGPPPTLRR